MILLYTGWHWRWRRSRWLVRGGHLDVVDDEGIDGAFSGLKPEAELLLQCGDQAGGGVGVGVGIVFGGPEEGEGVAAGEAGLVEDGAMAGLGERGGEVGHGFAAGSELPIVVTEPHIEAAIC